MQKGYERFADVNAQKVSLRDIVNGPLKNRSFKYIAGLFAFGIMASALAGTVGLYYMKYFMG